MLLAIAALVVGFAVLVWSADKFVYGASNTAASFKISPLIVGVVIVGLGTSAPEMLVSAMAAYSGNTGLSVGNALGSNITNIGLILGVTALVVPMTVRSRIVRNEMPLLMFVMAASSALLLDKYLSFADGCILLSGFVALLAWTVYTAKSHPEDILNDEFSSEFSEPPSRFVALGWLIFGMALLIASSRLLVWGAVSIATSLGISDLIIGLTIVAIGTSLPELAASLAAAHKREYDIAIGNVVGSNMFNLLGVMALPALIKPAAIDAEVLHRDVPMMLALGLALWLFSSNFKLIRPGALGRAQGLALVLSYFGYIAYLLYQTLLA